MAHVMAVIVLLGVLLMGAVLGIAMQGDTADADGALSDYEFRLLARDASTTGLQMTVYKLADSYDMLSWTSGTYFDNASYKNGSFTSTVTAANPSGSGGIGDTVDVVVRGANGPGRHAIFARYARDKDDKGIPPAFKHAIVSDEFMQIDGNMLIAAINDGFNASIHTNDDMTVKGNSFVVEGFGTYTGTINLNNQASDNFLPNIDYNGPDEPNHHWADSVDVPRIDAARLLNTAQTISGSYIDAGPFSIEGDALVPPNVIDFTDPANPFWAAHGYNCPSGACGTENNPFVMYVNGTADFFNTVEVVGNGVIIATENITVSPNGSGGGIYGALNADQETTVVLASLKNITVGKSGGNSCLGRGPASYTANDGGTRANNHCQSPDGTFADGLTLYAEEAVYFKGTPFIVGGVVAKKSEFTGGGDPWITYASPNEGVLDLGFEYIVPIGPVLIAYSEF